MRNKISLLPLGILWFTSNIASAIYINTTLERSESCSVYYNDSTFCKLGVYQHLLSTIPFDDSTLDQEYSVLNASQSNRIFMIRWGYISSSASSQRLTTYSIENNVFIESFMDDSSRTDGLYANEYKVYEWSIKDDAPSNIFPDKNSYISCDTVYLKSTEYINQISYDLDEDNLDALIGLKFVTSSSETFICPPSHGDTNWDYTYSASGLVNASNDIDADDKHWMFTGFEFKVFGDQEILNNIESEFVDEIYVKTAVFAGFESIEFGYSCNAPCYTSDSLNRRVYNALYFTESSDVNNEYLAYNVEYAMDFESAQSICSSIGSSLATIHAINLDAVSSLGDDIWIGSTSHLFWIDDTPILSSSLSSHVTVYDSGDNECGYLTVAGTKYEMKYDNCSLSKAFYCNNPESQMDSNRVVVWLRSCDGWHSTNHENGEFHLIFKGESQFSPFIIVNEGILLPSDDTNSTVEEDKWLMYDLTLAIDDISHYGQLIQWEVQMDAKQENAWNIFDVTSNDFCIAGFVLQFGDAIYSKTSSIKDGVILSTKCSNQWILHDTQPYLQCFDTLFLFSALSSNRAQYKVSLQTCPQSSSDVSESDIENLKISLTGKSFIEGTWTNTEQMSLSYAYPQPVLSSILTSVASQNVYLVGDLLTGSELTKYIIRGSEYYGNLIAPQDFAFSPSENGKILGYHLSYKSTVRLETTDGKYNDLLLPIMYKLSYATAEDYIADDKYKSTWDDIVAQVSTQEDTIQEVIIIEYNETTGEEIDYYSTSETVQQNSFLAPDDTFCTIHDYKERTMYITDNDDEIYVIFNEAKEVTTADYFMIAMVWPELGRPWGDYFWSCDNEETSSESCPRTDDSKLNWDEYLVAADVYGYLTTGAAAQISFIYQDEYKSYQEKPFTLNEVTAENAKTWEEAGSLCYVDDEYSNLASITSTENLVWAQLEIPNNDNIASTTEPIFVRLSNKYQWVYDGHGVFSDCNRCDASKDDKLALYMPVVNHDEYWISMQAEYKGEDVQVTTIVISGGPADAFAVPTDFTRTWRDKGSGGSYNVWFAQPQAPDGYVCIGDVAWLDETGGYDQRAAIHDNLYGYRCINEKYLIEDPVSSTRFWDSDHTGANDKGYVSYTTHDMQFGDSSTYSIDIFELHGKYGGERRETFYKFNSENTLLYSSTRNDADSPWIGLKQVDATKEWLWVDQTEFTSDTITTTDTVSSSGDCGTLSTRLLSTSVKTSYAADDCDETKKYFICETADNGDWSLDEEKSFLVTVPPNLFDEVILVSLENTGDNAICIDELSVNTETATFISSYWIANTDNTDSECITHSCQATSYGIIKYPVCNIEVIDSRYNFEDDDDWEETSNLTAAFSECKNYNRLDTASCEISQSFTVANEVGVEIADSFTYTEAYSSGTSKVKEDTTTKSQGFSVGAEAGMSGTDDNKGATLLFSGEYSQDWSYETSSATERFSESSYEESTERSTTNSWSQTEEHDVTCVASIDVPPSHKQMYSLLMNRYRGIVPTSQDLRLTLCSAFIDPEDSNNPEHYVYIYNVPSQQYISSITKCVVQFDRPSILLNHLTCDQEQELSFLSGSDYMPTCNDTEPTKYDGCQCQIIDALTSAVCACVDTEGNIFNNNAAIVVERDDWRDVCRLDLDCPNSKWNLPTSAPTDTPTSNPTPAPTNAPTYSPTDAPTNAPTNAPTDCIHDIRSFEMVAAETGNWEGFTVSGNCFHSNYFNHYVNNIHPEAYSPDQFSLTVDFGSLTSSGGNEWGFSRITPSQDSVTVDIITNNNILLDDNVFPAVTYSLDAVTNDIDSKIDTVIDLKAHIFHMGYNAFATEDNSDAYCCDAFNELFNGITFELFMSGFPFNIDDEWFSISFDFAIDTFWNSHLKSNIDAGNPSAQDNGMWGSDFSDHYNDLLYLYLPTFAYIDGYLESNKQDIFVDIQHSTDNDGISTVTITFPIFTDSVHFGNLETQETETDIPLFNHPLNNKIYYGRAVRAHQLQMDDIQINGQQYYDHTLMMFLVVIAVVFIFVSMALAIYICVKNGYQFGGYKVATLNSGVMDSDRDSD